MDPLTAVPQPRDIPLPLPADPVLLQAVLVVLFLLHILFVNLMVGGSLIALACEIAGRRRCRYDAIAREIVRTITVNKSLAVVLGVGPLLAINVLYTVPFYSANALTGAAWIGIVPLVTAAFLAAYAHKYSWDRLAERAKPLHIALGGLAAAIFLFVPFGFLANVNLMLFPARWPQVHGLLSAVALPNVIPRWLHFVCASVAVAALFLLHWFTRPGYPLAQRLPECDRAGLRRLFYSVALGASLLQIVMGPLVLFTLPREGMSWFLVLVIGIGASCGLAAMALMAREVVVPDPRVGRRFVAVVALITATAFCMGYGRHVYRENALRSHREAMAVRTADYGWAAAAARWREASGVSAESVPLGERIFAGTCASCHAVDRVLVGPSLREIAQIYAGDPAGIAKWAAAPGRKRAGMPLMPAFRLGEEKLLAVGKHMLELGSAQAPAAEPAPAAPAAPATPAPAGG